MSIHLVMDTVHLTASLGIYKTTPLATTCLNKLMHVEKWETDYLQHEDISYKFTLAWVFVSHAQITMNTFINDYGDDSAYEGTAYSIIMSHDYFHNSPQLPTTSNFSVSDYVHTFLLQTISCEEWLCTATAISANTLIAVVHLTIFFFLQLPVFTSYFHSRIISYHFINSPVP